MISLCDRESGIDFVKLDLLICMSRLLVVLVAIFRT